MHWRVQTRAACCISNKHDQTTIVTATATPPQIPRMHCRCITRLTFLYIILNEHVAVTMNHLDKFGSVWQTCQRTYYQTETQDTSLCLNSVSKVLCCKRYYWVEFTTRLYNLIGFGTILQKPAVCSLCCIVPVGGHTSLPQYPPGVWQLLSSRPRSRHETRPIR